MALSKKEMKRLAEIQKKYSRNLPNLSTTEVSCGLDQLHDIREYVGSDEKEIFEVLYEYVDLYFRLTEADVALAEKEGIWLEVDPSGFGVLAAADLDCEFISGIGTGVLMSDALKNKNRPGAAVRFVKFLRRKKERVYDCGPPHVNRNTGNVIQHWLWLPSGVEVKE